MKLSITTLTVSLVLFQSCVHPVNQPQAEVGWNGNQQIVRVTDDNGQQFLINYLLYRQLFSSGGYNNVVHYYYSNPNSHGIYLSSTPFSRGKTLTNFSRNYRYMAVKKSVYKPAPTNRNMARRSASYIRANKIYSRKTSNSYKPTTRTFYRPVRSTYRSSFRSFSRAGRR